MNGADSMSPTVPPNYMEGISVASGSAFNETNLYNADVRLFSCAIDWDFRYSFYPVLHRICDVRNNLWGTLEK